MQISPQPAEETARMLVQQFGAGAWNVAIGCADAAADDAGARWKQVADAVALELMFSVDPDSQSPAFQPRPPDAGGVSGTCSAA